MRSSKMINAICFFASFYVVLCLVPTVITNLYPEIIILLVQCLILLLLLLLTFMTETTNSTASSTISCTNKNCRQHIITVIVGTYCMLLTTVAIIAIIVCCHLGNSVQVWFISLFFLEPLETNNHSHPLHAAIGQVCGGVNTGRL